MKTSNKILVSLLILVFAVPLILASTLKRKINKGEYTVHSAGVNGVGSKRSGTFTAFKVVKVTAPRPSLLRCHLIPSDSMQFLYRKGYHNDSLVVATINDTLFINYAATKNKDKDADNFDNLNINVHLPAFNNLVVDGASVIIDSFPASPGNLSITLKNNGSVQDGTKKPTTDAAKRTVENNSSIAGKMNTVTSTSVAANDQKKAKSSSNPGLKTSEVNMKYLLISGIAL